MQGPENLRVYGLWLRDGKILIAAEIVGDRFAWKYPGGGVEPGETPERALVREFIEETGLKIGVERLLHVPGTLFSPWTHANYTPLYYAIGAEGEPAAPDHEPIELAFVTPDAALRSGMMAEPEIEALSRLLDGQNPGK